MVQVSLETKVMVNGQVGGEGQETVFLNLLCFFVLMIIMMMVTIMAMVSLIRLLGHQCCGIGSNSFPMFSMKSRKLSSISLIFAKCGKAQFLKVKVKLESQSEAVTTFPYKGEELSRW